MGYTLLTGATGLLGSYLLRDLLSLGRPVAVLVRPTRQRSSHERIEDTLAPFERSDGRRYSRPVALSGDITETMCGLSDADQAWVAANCDQVIHSAASLAFVEEKGEPRRSNVVGTQHVLDLCEAAGIKRLAHVSTAYVCGLTQGTFYEHQLDHGHGYGNIYEETKAEAERKVRAANFIEELTVFRPSIIVGDSRTGYTTTFHGFYTPLRVLQALRFQVTAEQAFSASYLSALGMRGDERKNFVPVDWVSDAMVKTLSRQTVSGRTYALTSDRPVTVDALRQAFGETLYEHVTESTREGFAQGGALSMGAFEEQFRDQFSVYESYWRDDCDFDRTNSQELLADTPCPIIDYEMLVKLSRFALQANFGFPKPRPITCAFWVRGWLEKLGEQVEAWNDTDDPVNLIATGQGGGDWSLGWTATGEMKWSTGARPGRATLRAPADCLARVETLESSMGDLLTQGDALANWPSGAVDRFDASATGKAPQCADSPLAISQ